MLTGKRRAAPRRDGGRPTIKMIAGLAGVAPSTVSRALNDDPSISDATRRRVARIASRLGFVPNAAARGLVTRRSSVVALILGLSPNPFYLEMIPVISQRLAARGMGLMIFRMGDNDRIEDTLGALARHHVGGCLVAAASLTREAARLCSRFNIPIVMINRLAEVQGSSVNCDNRDAGRQVGRLLLAEGRRRLAYVGGEAAVASFQDAEREAGFREALEAAGVAAPRRLSGPYSYDGGLAAAGALCAGGVAECPDGIFVANDIMAFGVIDGLRRAGVAIPGGTSIVGFDDLPQARWIGYDLSTVRQPIDALVAAALEILDRRVEDAGAPAESVFVAAELVRRGTTR